MARKGNSPSAPGKLPELPLMLCKMCAPGSRPVDSFSVAAYSEVDPTFQPGEGGKDAEVPLPESQPQPLGPK